jgi:dTDP-4-amino-4,6-dideoxygalactose transaminase
VTVLAESFKGDPFMPVAVPFLDLAAMHGELRVDLDAAWHRMVHDSAFVGGAAVETFEREWAAFCGTKHAVGVANGTDAIVLALRGLGVGPGDEVILPANTFVATAEAVVLVGAVPRFVDVDPGTLLMTAAHVEAAVTPRTAAVIVVHLYGQMPDMDAILTTARRAGLAVIEDAAQAHGATWHNRRAGSFGDAATFSFYPGKNLGAFGDAGAVVTSDPDLANRIRSTGDHGRRLGHKYVHDVSGTNSRLDALQAAVLSVKLRRLEGWNSARRAAMRQYASRLTGSDADLVAVADGARSVHHLAVVQVDERDAVAARLEHCGIATGVHYPVPCHQQLAFQEYRREPLPVCDASALRILSLPLFPTISRAQIDWVCTALTTPLRLMSDLRRPDTVIDLQELGHVG